MATAASKIAARARGSHSAGPFFGTAKRQAQPFFSAAHAIQRKRATGEAEDEHRLQTQPRVGGADDRSTREADRVADQTVGAHAGAPDAASAPQIGSAPGGAVEIAAATPTESLTKEVVDAVDADSKEADATVPATRLPMGPERPTERGAALPSGVAAAPAVSGPRTAASTPPRIPSLPVSVPAPTEDRIDHAAARAGESLETISSRAQETGQEQSARVSQEAAQAEAQDAAAGAAAEAEPAMLSRLIDLLDDVPESPISVAGEDFGQVPARLSAPRLEPGLRPEGATAPASAPTAAFIAASGSLGAPEEAGTDAAETVAAPVFELAAGVTGEEASAPAAPAMAFSVNGLVAALTAAPADAEARVQAKANTARASVNARAQSVRSTIGAAVESSISELSTAFNNRRVALDAALAAAQLQIDVQLLARKSEAIARGERGRTEIREVFNSHRETIASAVALGISDAEALRTRYGNRAHIRTAEQSRSARNRGRARAASYPDTRRGRVQANAAWGVANRTAREMEDQEPKVGYATDQAGRR